MKRRTLKQAIDDWHKAWDGSKATWAWNCHHDILLEPLCGSPEVRFNYILNEKPKNQRLVRLDNFRPVNWTFPKWVKNISLPYKRSLVKMIKSYNYYLKSDKHSYYLWEVYLEKYDEYTKQSIKYIEELNKYKDYLEQVHDIDVLNSTWNGKDIFKKKK